MSKNLEKIESFLASPAFAVVGASADRMKYGNKVYRHYLHHGKVAYPVNPRCPEIDGKEVYGSLAALPEKVDAVSIITPPSVTESVVDDAIACGIKFLWMQPGAESTVAIDKAEAAGLVVIYGGPCLLIELQ